MARSPLNTIIQREFSFVVRDVHSANADSKASIAETAVIRTDVINAFRDTMD